MSNEPKIKDYTMTLHLSMDKKHSSLHTGIIVWEGNPINGKKIIVESHTPKHRSGDFGKSKTTYYLEGKDTPMFKTAEAFYKFYSSKPPIK